MRPQAFIPVWSPSFGITHILAIPISDFDPMPSSVYIAGHSFPSRLVPIRQVNHRGRNGAFEIAVLEFTDDQVRRGQNAVPGAVPIHEVLNFGTNFTIRGQHIEVRAVIDWITNMFFYGAPFYGSYGSGGPFAPPPGPPFPPPPPPPPPLPTMNPKWTVTTPFAASPNCQFYDLDWVSAFANTYPGQTPVSISVSPPTDPLVAASLKAFIVQSIGFGTVVVGGTTPASDTIRFVKTTSAALPAGTHVYPAVITSKLSDGTTITNNIDIELIL
jgi:hypothetical protein